MKKKVIPRKPFTELDVRKQIETLRRMGGNLTDHARALRLRPGSAKYKDLEQQWRKAGALSYTVIAREVPEPKKPEFTTIVKFVPDEPKKTTPEKIPDTFKIWFRFSDTQDWRGSSKTYYDIEGARAELPEYGQVEWRIVRQVRTIVEEGRNTKPAPAYRHGRKAKPLT